MLTQQRYPALPPLLLMLTPLVRDLRSMPLLQLMLRIAAGVFTTTPYGPQSNDERLVWCIALWGVSAAVHALLRLWCVLSYACLDGYGVSETRA